MLHLILPMAGGGTRFLNKGFQTPKPLIELQGHPFFFWSAQSVRKFVPDIDITFAVLSEHVEKYHIDREIKTFFPECSLVTIPYVLDGAVLTCLEAVKRIRDDRPLLFNDCDHAFLCSKFYEFCNSDEIVSNCPDAALLTFKSDSPAFSYVKYGSDGRVEGTVEKEVASNSAICGAYFFKNREIFEKYRKCYLNNCHYNEFFMSGVYNSLALEGKKIKIFDLDRHVSFGTPEEYIEAMKEDLQVFL